MFSSQRTVVRMCLLFGRKLILPVRFESGCTSHSSSERSGNCAVGPEISDACGRRAKTSLKVLLNSILCSSARSNDVELQDRGGGLSTQEWQWRSSIGEKINC